MAGSAERFNRALVNRSRPGLRRISGDAGRQFFMAPEETRFIVHSVATGKRYQALEHDPPRVR